MEVFRGKRAGVKWNAEQLERVAGLFQAFSDAGRLAILQELKSGERSVSEMVKVLSTSQANVSKQLKRMHDAGILGRRKQGAQVFYWIEDPMVFELCRLVCDKLNREQAKWGALPFG